MRSLWIEAGDMSGGSRNQIEFDDDIAAFFGIELPSLGKSVELLVDVGTRKWHECGFAAKRTTYGVTIYRLSLPTVAKGGHEYPGTIIKISPAGGRYFKVAVESDGSDEHSAWRRASTENSTLTRTGGAGGREYGFLKED